MHTGLGRVVEIILADGCRYARLTCPENLTPAPGQYLLASDSSNAPLPVPVFYTDSSPQGFIGTAAATWNPGQQLSLRGPLGRAFRLPLSARRIGLLAFDDSPARLRSLIPAALKQNALVVLVSDWSVTDLPDDIEVQPLSTLEEILNWADYLAADVDREHFPALMERLDKYRQVPAVMQGQALIRTAIPCGGIAECGVCAVVTKSGWQMACKDGPVFDLQDL